MILRLRLLSARQKLGGMWDVSVSASFLLTGSSIIFPPGNSCKKFVLGKHRTALGCVVALKKNSKYLFDLHTEFLFLVYMDAVSHALDLGLAWFAS